MRSNRSIGGRGDWHTLAEKIERSSTSWLLPGITGGPDARYARPSRPERISIAATDGSQIFPDRHEISPCYLINIGYILLHYGSGERPIMSSKPSLFYKDEDLFRSYGGRRQAINRELVGFRRSLMELTELSQLACAAHEEGYPTLALADGTLIMWSLEAQPPDFRSQYLESMLSALDALRRRRVPIASYMSRPGGQDLTNALRLGLCPLETANCDRCPWMDGELPCGTMDGIGDAVLLRRLLNPGERSAVFASSSRILHEYGDHSVCFFYVHVGAEVARVEIPRWVAEDGELVDLVHACICDQTDKGRGYPVSLSEAHEKAVVRAGDRESFYRYIQESFVRNDIGVLVSNKNLRKRHATV